MSVQVHYFIANRLSLAIFDSCPAMFFTQTYVHGSSGTILGLDICNEVISVIVNYDI